MTLNTPPLSPLSFSFPLCGLRGWTPRPVDSPGPWDLSFKQPGPTGQPQEHLVGWAELAGPEQPAEGSSAAATRHKPLLGRGLH